jgi:hypothetical protein
MGNHYGDQRAEMELAVDELMQVMRKNQILSVDREDRGELSVDELNKVEGKDGRIYLLICGKRQPIKIVYFAVFIQQLFQ